MKRALATALLGLLLATPAWAGVYEGIAAWKRGDYATALREFKPMAERGDAGAQYNLGVMYANGRGVPRDDAEAAKWFNKATEQGNAKAQYALGLLYGHGHGVPQDYAKAVSLWLPIAEKGDTAAQYVLGIMYAKGQGVPQDYLQAYKWYNLAASKGDKLAVAARDTLAARMTPADLSEAQRLSREWLAAFRKGAAKPSP